MSNIKIRSATFQDMDQIVNLCKLHAEYEEQPYNRNGKLEKLSAVLFQKRPFLWCLVADKEGVIVGYATATKEFSTWDAAYYLHMDCLFVLESTRGSGIGAKLLTEIADLAIELSCSHVQWQTPFGNNSAIKFYEKCGAISKDKKRFFFEVRK